MAYVSENENNKNIALKNAYDYLCKLAIEDRNKLNKNYDIYIDYDNDPGNPFEFKKLARVYSRTTTATWYESITKERSYKVLKDIEREEFTTTKVEQGACNTIRVVDEVEVFEKPIYETKFEKYTEYVKKSCNVKIYYYIIKQENEKIVKDLSYKAHSLNYEIKKVDGNIKKVKDYFDFINQKHKYHLPYISHCRPCLLLTIVQIIISLLFIFFENKIIESDIIDFSQGIFLSLAVMSAICFIVEFIKSFINKNIFGRWYHFLAIYLCDFLFVFSAYNSFNISNVFASGILLLIGLYVATPFIYIAKCIDGKYKFEELIENKKKEFENTKLNFKDNNIPFDIDLLNKEKARIKEEQNKYYLEASKYFESLMSIYPNLKS